MNMDSTDSRSRIRVNTPVKPMATKPPPWPRERILAEARKRARDIATENSKQTQQMLAKLCREAGWSDEDFLNVLLDDVIANGKLPGRR